MKLCERGCMAMKGGDMMKLINPLGREVEREMYSGDGITPMACMCSAEGAYATARGKDDCFKCGCSSSSTTYSANNSHKAFWTMRKSGTLE